MLDTQQRQDVKYFTGTEVEHTICYGKKTLFVVGIQPVEEILKLAQEHNCDHIYFGTSQTFNTQEMSSADYIRWEEMILPILDANLWATLDFDVRHIEAIHESGYCDYDRFVPMVSVKMPYLKLLNYNTTVKIDDITWGATNSGVWSVPLGDLTQRKYYTHWEQYTQDTEIT